MEPREDAAESLSETRYMRDITVPVSRSIRPACYIPARQHNIGRNKKLSPTHLLLHLRPKTRLSNGPKVGSWERTKVRRQVSWLIEGRFLDNEPFF